MGTYIRKQNVIRTEGLSCIPEHLLWSNCAARAIIAMCGEVGRHKVAGCALLVEVKPKLGCLIEPLIQHPERMCQIADQFDFRVIVLVNFRGKKVRVDYVFVSRLDSKVGVVLDHVESQGNDQIRILDCQRHMVPGAQAYRVEAVSASISTAPFAMNVLTTPIPVASQNLRNCSLARFRTQPLPARMIGRLAFFNRSNA